MLLSELREPIEGPFTKLSEGPLTSFTLVSEARERVRAEGRGREGRKECREGEGRKEGREGEGRKAASISLQVDEEEEEELVE